MHKLRLLWAAHNEENMIRRRKRHVSRPCFDQIIQMQDDLFRERFRLDKKSFWMLCRDLRAHALLRGTSETPLELKVLCALSFLATGSYQKVVGVTYHLTQRTASRCIRQVIEALNSNYMLRNIGFPQTLIERSKIRQEFQRRFNLPDVIGCIGCTHVAIIKPETYEQLYFNNEGYYSLNVQVICDHNLRILDVDSKYGGATNDSDVWASSQVEPIMRELHQSGEQTWLLGDSKYPQRPWLMTPIVNAAPGSKEEVYTIRHIEARNCIEQCFDLLKTRWRCLQRQPLHYHPHVAIKIVLACCVLHNIALQADLSQPVDVARQHHDDGDDDGGGGQHHDDDEEVLSDSSAPSSEEDLTSSKAIFSNYFQI